MRPEPTPTVAAWIADRDTEELCLTAMSEAELLYGVAIMPTSRRRSALEVAMSRWLDLGFTDRILPFNSSAARAWAVIASRHHAGRPIGEADYRIAAISRSHCAVLATPDVRDFEASFPESRQTGDYRTLIGRIAGGRLRLASQACDPATRDPLCLT